MNRYEKILFQLTIFLIPTNLAWHWITSNAYVNGILVDYLIPKLYLSDLPILLLLLFWLITSRTDLEVDQNKSFSKSPFLVLIFSSFILLIRVFYTSHPLAGVWYFLKLLELSLFFLWLKNHYLNTAASKSRDIFSSFKTHSSANKKKSIADWIAMPFVLSMFFQSLLGLYQFLSQHSLAGYWFLGETTLTFTANIAKAMVWPFTGLRILPYGTTSHPNVLAGFLAIGLMILVSYWKQIKFPAVFKLLTLTFALFAMYLTQSLSAWLTLAVGLLIVFLQSHRFKRSTIMIFLILVAFLFRTTYYDLRSTDSIVRRQQLNLFAWQMFLDHPVTGIGLNQFTAVLPSYGVITAYTSFLQPAHNIYLLWLSETGLVGLFLIVILVFFLTSKSRDIFSSFALTWPSAKHALPTSKLLQSHSSANKKKSVADWIVMIPIMMLLIIGLADHYPLTLQTGQLLLFMTLALYTPFNKS